MESQWWDHLEQGVFETQVAQAGTGAFSVSATHGSSKSKETPVRDCIEESAERLLEHLKKSGQTNILLLPGAIGERSVMTYQALGWLAREGRIEYLRRASQTYVAACSEEVAPEKQ